MIGESSAPGAEFRLRRAAVDEPLTLGRLTLSSRYLLAPLESVSDCAFRHLCHGLGASLTFTEMIRAQALARKNGSTLDLIDSFEPEVPTGLQLLATSPTELSDALGVVEELAFGARPHFRHLVAIDLNFGCPSPEVIRRGAGPALLKRKKRLGELFAALRDFQRHTKLSIGAVGAKIRLGLNAVERREKPYLAVAELASEHLDWLTVHARHARQDSKEPADWSAIAEVKRACRAKVIGNGDVFSPDDARRLFEQTGCDGALVARGAIRSPWLFRALAGRGAAEPTAAELDEAERDYFGRARRLATRPKYLEWHTEGFRRMRERLQGRETGPLALPPNEHMS